MTPPEAGDGSAEGETSLDPVDWSELRAQGRQMLDDMFDRFEELRDAPVWRSPPDAVRARYRAPAPLQPTPVADVYARFLADIAPYASGNVHPGFMGWAQGGGTAIGMLAEMLAGALNANLGGRDHMPIEVERQVLAWVVQMFGFPNSAGGLLVTGASQASFIGVLLARNRALGVDVRRRGLGDAGAGLVAYTSAAAHSCLDRAMDMAGLGSERLRRIPVDADQRIRLDALCAAIAQDRSQGLQPFLIAGTAGTVDTGAIDDLNGLADIAVAEAINFHVDGALGALGVLSPALKPRFAGLERCDSLAGDFHKWGQVPYDAGFILVRDGEAQRSAFAWETSYLGRAPRGLAAGDWWPCDYGPDLSRGFRALKVWFTLMSYGEAALGAVMARTCDLAGTLAARLDAEPELERLAPVALNVVCFRYRPPDTDGRQIDWLNRQIIMDLHDAGRVVPSQTQINGRVAIRAAIVNHRTRSCDIGALADAVLAAGRRRLSTVRSGGEGGDASRSDAQDPSERRSPIP